MAVPSKTMRYTLAGNMGLAAREVGSQAKSLNNQSFITIYEEYELTAAQILALFTTAATIVAAPGANKVLEFVSATLLYDYGSAAYTIGSATNLQFKYTNNSGAAASATVAVTGLLDQTDDEYRIVPQNSSSIEPVVNSALVLGLAGANVTAGNGTMKIRLTYRIHSFVA